MNSLFPLKPERIYAEFQQKRVPNDHFITVNKALGENLVQRLPELKLEPKIIVDLGAGSGMFTAALSQLYPEAKVIAVDYALSQLQALGDAKKSALCARAELLPFATESVDVIFCHMLLQWCVAPEILIHEIQRVLKPNGVLLFSVLAPDSLKELRDVFSTLSDKPYIPSFTDMHHWGDLLLQAQFKNPVVDADYFSVYYKNFSQLMLSLRQGPIYFLEGMNKGLMTPRQWQHLEKTYERYRDEYGLALTLEVVYGVAFAKSIQSNNRHSQEVSIFLQNVQRKK